MTRILIIEDEQASAAALGKLLQSAGYDIETATSGPEALGAIMQAVPDLVVLDLGLPGPDGASILEIMRSSLALQNLPVIVWTGSSDSQTADRARQLGAAAVIDKGKSTTLDAIFGAVRAAVGDKPH